MGDEHQHKINFYREIARKLHIRIEFFHPDETEKPLRFVIHTTELQARRFEKRIGNPESEFPVPRKKHRR